jgi:hypothetical protein
VAVSVFSCTEIGSIDGKVPTFVNSDQWEAGLLFLGGTKTAQRRGISRFNVFGTAIEGRPLNAGDELTAA